MNVSVVIPAYNEERNIVKTLHSVTQFFNSKQYEYEIIVVDDGSHDQTKILVENYAACESQIRCIVRDKNYGKGSAVRLGMKEATGTFKLFMDADSSVSIEELDYFIKEIENGSDIVIGSIHIDNAQCNDKNNKYRRLAGNLVSYFIRVVNNTGVRDTQRGFKLFKKSAADIVFSKQTLNRFGFDIEVLTIAKKYKLKIKELPVHFSNPPGSTVNVFSYITTGIELFRIKWNLLLNKY